MSSSRIIYIEPFSGISGDMMLGALLDLGLDIEWLRERLSQFPMSGYHLSAKKCLRAGIQATKFDVHAEHQDRGNEHVLHEHPHHPHRSFRDIRKMIESSGLSAWVKEKATEAFRRLAEAEGKIHDRPAEEVHFHEVGAMDSIVDIVGSMIALEHFLPARILSSAVNVGHGTLECQHGIYPVPGPAALELLKGVPTFTNAVGGELTTPTGATLLTTLATEFRSPPLMKVQVCGYGAGARETPGNANALRITVGEDLASEQAPPPDAQVAVIEATIDDMNPQIFGHFLEQALTAGALDVYTTPIFMKKNRPAHLLSVVCAVGHLDALAGMIFAETTTIGIRYTLAERRTLQRQFYQVQTEYGVVRIKASFLRGRRVNFIPEYEDCRRLALERGVALKDVMSAAAHAYLQLEGAGRAGEAG
jgi:pyridinium-3,5-bisthiocarboxylic acid mononucleotide nickel chelatase